MLMTVRNITGLDTPTLQNWVHRGWVKRPVHKKYSVDHLARILIINALRPVTSMENIATVLNTVCGSVDGSREGIVSDALFYEYFFSLDKTFISSITLSFRQLSSAIAEFALPRNSSEAINKTNIRIQRWSKSFASGFGAS